MVGDPRYLSPEQLLDHDLTELADVYAVGVRGYELYTGDGPYEAKTNTQWITAHLTADPRDLRQIRPDVDPEAVDLLRRCLNREPNHRPRAADAARLLKGETTTGGHGTDGARGATGGHAASGEGVGDVQELLKRRVPQIVLAAAAGGLGFRQFMDMLVDRETLPRIARQLTLPFVGCGVVASAVVAWFHVEKGKQEASAMEYVLLAAIAVV